MENETSLASSAARGIVRVALATVVMLGGVVLSAWVVEHEASEEIPTHLQVKP